MNNETILIGTSIWIRNALHCSVFVDGDYYGETDKKGNFEIKDLLYGYHVIECKKLKSIDYVKRLKDKVAGV